MDISKQIEFTKEVREQDRDLKALAVRDIEKEAQQARDRFIERTKNMSDTEKFDAYSNCMMSTALLLVDRWGARFIPDICDALQLEQEELESTLNETDVLECIDLEGRGTAELKEDPEALKEEILSRAFNGLENIRKMIADGQDANRYIDRLKGMLNAAMDGSADKMKAAMYTPVNRSWTLAVKNTDGRTLERFNGHIFERVTALDAADDGTKSGTGAADPGTVSEIMKRLNRIEESLHSIGQQVEAIWLKTGAVELDAESIAEDLEETDTQQ